MPDAPYPLPEPSQEAAPYKYLAFISYSRKDSKAARWLQRRLEWFRIPVKLVPGSRFSPEQRYLRPVYRDKTNLEVDAAHYAANINRAIEQSRFLIVLCSPHSAASEPVNQEIEHFLQSRKEAAKSLLPVVLSGTVGGGESGCLCEALLALGSQITDRNLPTMVPDGDDSEQEGWENGFIGIASFLLHLDRDKLRDHVRREEKRRVARARVLAGMFAILAALAVIGGLYAYWNGQEARRQKVLAVDTLANARLQQTVEKLTDDDAFAALPYALNAHELRPQDPVAPALLFSMLTHHVPAVPIYQPLQLSGHPSTISTNEDGNQLITSGLGFPLQVWSLTDGRKLAEIHAGGAELCTGGFTVDGKGSFHQSDKDMRLRIWSGLPNGEPVGQFSLPIPLRYLPYSSSGGPLIATLIQEAAATAEMMGGGKISFNSWPLAMGDLAAWKTMADTQDDSHTTWDDTHKTEISKVVMSRDGTRAATGDKSGKVVTWDLVKRVKLREIDCESEINVLALSPDGAVVMVGTQAGKLGRYDVTTGTNLTSWNFGDYACLAADQSADGSVFAASNEGKSGWVQTWDGGNGKRLSQHKLGVEAEWLKMAKDGQTIFGMGNWDGFSIIDVASKSIERANLLHRFQTKNSGWSESTGLAWILDESHKLRTYRTDASSLSCLLLPHLGEGVQAHFSKDGRRLLIVASDPDCHQVWDTTSGLPLHTLVKHSSAVMAADFSLDGETVVVTCQDGSAHRWSAVSGEKMHELLNPVGLGVAVSQMSENRQWLAQTRIDMNGFGNLISGLEDSLKGLMSLGGIGQMRKSVVTKLLIFDCAGNKAPPAIELPGQYIQIACSNDGSRVLVFGSPEVGAPMEVVSIKNGKPGERLPLPGLGGMAMKLSGSGKYAVAPAGANGAVLLGVEPLRVIAKLPHLQDVNAVAFSHDENLVATASDDGTTKVWRSRDGSAVGKSLEHTAGSGVYTVAFSPNDQWIATAGSDEEAVVWNPHTGQRASINLTADDDLRQVEFSPDGKWLVTCGDDGTARIWEWLTPENISPPPWIREVVSLVTEREVGMNGEEQTVSKWDKDDLLTKAQALSPGPWRAAVENLFLPASQRSITPTTGFNMAQDRLRRAKCAILLGREEEAFHLVRQALKSQPELKVPAELEHIRRVLGAASSQESATHETVAKPADGEGAKAGDRTINGHQMALRWCPPGRFMMGSPPKSYGHWGNETFREVYLTRGYWAGETEVTQRQWKDVMGQTLVELAQDAIEDTTQYPFDGENDPKKTISQKLGLPTDLGAEPKGYLGLRTESVADAKGIRVIDATPDSPGDQAGIKGGDIILTVGSQSVPDVRTFVQTVSAMKPGTEVSIRIRRGASEIPLTATLGEKPKQPNEQGARFIGIQEPDYPIYWVTLKQAEQFCDRLTEAERTAGKLKEGWAYRLPSEAEWEYACRAGSNGTVFDTDLKAGPSPFNAPELNDICWYGGNSCQDYPSGPGWNCESWEGRAFPGNVAGPRKVGQKKPNGWGLLDTLGNLHEWTSSIEGEDLIFQRVNPQVTAAKPADKGIFRGGCWNNFAVGCRTAARTTEHPAFRSHYLGFRVVLAPMQHGPESAHVD